jgi:uncharacterized protein (TIGR03437 family)
VKAVAALFILFTAAATLGSTANAQTITSEPASIVQSFQLGGAAVSVTASITGTGTVALSASTQSGGNWLSVTPNGGSLPLTVAINMDPSALPDGTYLGTISAGHAAIPVTILVGDPGPKLPANGIVNAASFQGGAVSPGEIVAIFGTGIGPKIPYNAQVWDGVMRTKLAGTRVWFGDVPAPISYAEANFLIAVVPYGVAGQSSVQVQVENLVARTPPFSIPVVAATPALFMANSPGNCQVAALNQDFTYNGPANPAAQGAAVVLFATGVGTMNPTVADGTVISSNPPAPALPVRLIIGGQDTELPYAKAAPTLVAGAMQINAIIPSGISSGNVPIVLKIGDFTSPDGCTISVK